MPGLDIRVFAHGGRLMLQATGQQALQVEVTDEDAVVSQPVGVKLRLRRKRRGEVIGIASMQSRQMLQAARR
jgi:hypothetical protein